MLPQYEGEERNRETISATLFHDSSGDVESDWCYCEYVVVVGSDIHKGEFQDRSRSISISIK